MSTAEKILYELSDLRPEDQAEVLDFVEFIKAKKSQKDDRDLKGFSLVSAMRGMEDEPDLYSASDIRQRLK
jgi:hypothetical protein